MTRARFRTIAGPRERQLVGVGLQMTMPGVPMVFAGDELGLEGAWGEDARRTMPWGGRRPGTTRSSTRYARWSRFAARATRWRAAGIRYLHVVDRRDRLPPRDARRTAALPAARAPHDPIRHPFRTELETLYGGTHRDGVLSCRRPRVHIWRDTMADVAFNEVDKVYDNGVQAVFGLTLDIHDGEFLVLVGPSGCGKTTALRMVAGLEDISDGTLSIGGRVVNDVSPKERDIAMVFQNYALYPHLSVAENIAFGLRLRKAPKASINERVAWAAKLLDLTPYLDRKPKELSGGQRQRVAMGRAIVRQPQVFLMDEPLSNLDAKLRVQMRADIAKLQRELETTTVYVTHDQVEAMTMGDRVAVMSKGVLQQVDAPQRLYDRPENLFVAGFIGTPPMNLLEAHVSANGGVSIDLGGEQLPIPDAGARELPQAPRVERPRRDRRPPRRRPPSGAGPRPAPPDHRRRRARRVARRRVDGVLQSRRTPVQGGGRRGEEELENEDEASVVGSRPNLVASFPPHVQLRIGDRVQIAVDAKNLHFFDEAVGAPLR